MTELLVWSVGASSPLGLDARQTALFWRAGKADPRSTPFRDKTGLTIGAARAERLPDDVVGYDRMLALAIPALEEALATAPPHLATEKTVLLLSLPEPYEGEDERIASRLLVELAKAVHLTLDDRSVAVRLGRSGVAALLGRAQIFGGDVRVIVGGVDSYYDAPRVATLDSGYRLLSERSGNGFIPSEAAAFTCVSPRAKKLPVDAKPLAAISFVSCGEEDLEGPPVFGCMTKLLKDARFPQPVPWVLTDVNGERHRTKEWQFASMRNRVRFDQDKTLVNHVPTEFGDVGAASGALLLAIGVMGISLGFAAVDSVAVVTSSEGKERGVFLLAGVPS